MSVLYQVPMLRPKEEKSEALFQEIQALRGHFGGDLLYINPNQRLPVWVRALQRQGLPLRIPRRFFGFQMLRELRRHEANISLHQIYNPDLFPYPHLRRLRKPVIYTLVGGAGEHKPSKSNVSFFKSLAAVTVADPQSLDRLKAWGLHNALLIQPGIDTKRFCHTPAPPPPPFRLLVASAPWTAQQFADKGIDTLLELLRLEPDLHITFLWRGLLANEMQQRVHALGVADRVTIVDKYVDVNRVLAGVHATVNLAVHAQIVKAYPNSLLDSLAAGKPLLLSRAIPMANYVEKKKVGIVAADLSIESVRTAVTLLRQRYDSLQQAALGAGQRDFSLKKLIESYERVYTKILQRRG